MTSADLCPGVQYQDVHLEYEYSLESQRRPTMNNEHGINSNVRNLAANPMDRGNAHEMS